MIAGIEQGAVRPDVDVQMLYELIVGALPFDPATLRAAGHQEILRIIQSTDSRFVLTAEDTARLKKEGVKESVIREMLSRRLIKRVLIVAPAGLEDLAEQPYLRVIGRDDEDVLDRRQVLEQADALIRPVDACGRHANSFAFGTATWSRSTSSTQ